jgi:hypothetical protein
VRYVPPTRIRTSVYLPPHIHKELKILAARTSKPGDTVDVNELLLIGARLVIAILKDEVDKEVKERLEELKARLHTEVARGVVA